MTSSLSNLVSNLVERINRIKINAYFAIKIIQTKYEKLKKKFKKQFTFFNKDINKFIFLLRKSVYPYEYMDDWEECNETSLSAKNNFIAN